MLSEGQQTETGKEWRREQLEKKEKERKDRGEGKEEEREKEIKQKLNV